MSTQAVIANEILTVPALTPGKQEQLDSISDELRSRGRALKNELFEIGKLLTQAKKILPYGGFKPWVKQNFEHSYRTAVNAMRVYRACIGRPELLEYFKPSHLYIICEPGFSSDLREALFEGVKGPVKADCKDLVDIGLRYKRGELEIADEPVQRLLAKRADIDLRKQYEIELNALETLIIQRLERIKALGTDYPSHSLISDNGHNGNEKWISNIVETVEGFTAALRHQIQMLKK